jgi:hypothetical protein
MFSTAFRTLLSTLQQHTKYPTPTTATSTLLSSSSSGEAAEEQEPLPLVLVASAESCEQVTASLRSCFTHELAMTVPDLAQRKLILQHVLAPVPSMYLRLNLHLHLHPLYLPCLCAALRCFNDAQSSLLLHL